MRNIVSGAAVGEHALERALPGLLQFGQIKRLAVGGELIGLAGHAELDHAHAVGLGQGSALVAVSYTHLDVYKRQMFGYATDLRSQTQGRASYTMQFDSYAVSYTHLAHPQRYLGRDLQDRYRLGWTRRPA